MDDRGLSEATRSSLMALPNVVAVGTSRDEKTGDELVLVLVTAKVPATELRAEEVVPKRVDGLRVRVRSVGDVTAQPQ